MKRAFRATATGVALTITGGVVVALAVFGVFGAHGAVPRTGPLSVHAGLNDPSGAVVRRDGLFTAKGGRSQLGAAVSGAMIGPLSPVAVRSSDGNIVAYNTWQELRTVDEEQSFSKQGIPDGDVLGTPSLRVHDDAGKDFLLARGAYSAAWRQDGAIAFVKGTDPNFRAGRSYTGQVVVQGDVHGPEVAWTSELAHYVVYAWAGDRLLFYRIGFGEKLELLVADGPGHIRSLTDGSAIAVSPDETRIAVLSQDATNVRVLDVATRRHDGDAAAHLARLLGLVGRRPHRRSCKRRPRRPPRRTALARARAGAQPRPRPVPRRRAAAALRRRRRQRDCRVGRYPAGERGSRSLVHPPVRPHRQNLRARRARTGEGLVAPRRRRRRRG